MAKKRGRQWSKGWVKCVACGAPTLGIQKERDTRIIPANIRSNVCVLCMLGVLYQDGLLDPPAPAVPPPPPAPAPAVDPLDIF